MIFSGAGFAVMGVFVKLGAQRGLGAIDMVFYRSLFGLIAIALVARYYRLPLQTPFPREHLSRGVFGLVSLLLYFYCLMRLPMATAVTLNYTSPLFLTLAAALPRRERLSRTVVLAVVGGFAGVVLLLRPTLNAEQFWPGLAGLISGVLAAGAYLSIERLGKVGEPDWRVVFYFTLVCSVATGGWVLFESQRSWVWLDVGILLCIGASATLAQLAMTRAFQAGRALLVGSLSYTAIVFASLFGMVFWREALPVSAWLGMAIIVACSIYAMRAASR